MYVIQSQASAQAVKAWVGNQVGQARMPDLAPLWQQPAVSSPRGVRPQFPGWECGGRGLGREGLCGAGFPPVSDQQGRGLANPASTPSPSSRDDAPGMERSAGFLENPGSGPHPGLHGGLLLRPSHSFICSFICSFILRNIQQPLRGVPTWGRALS